MAASSSEAPRRDRGRRVGDCRGSRGKEHQLRPIRRRYRHSLPAALAAGVEATLSDWDSRVERLWQKDASLWTGEDEDRWLGWLNIVGRQIERLDELRRIAGEVSHEGFSHIVVLGMGGSSLCPEVLGATFGRLPAHPELCVLDSTDPAQVKSVENRVDLGRTLFVVSSKSGTTLEPNVFKHYFHHRVRELLGPEEAGRRFVVITDPGSPLEEMAKADSFRWVFHGTPDIGGRYSALSDFGMVPAAFMGLDMARFLARAQEMVAACGPRVPAAENPGVVLGAVLGQAGLSGHDKITLVTSPGIRDLGAWLEQLLAESTGKQGKALIPVDGEVPAAPKRYGDDRLFAYLRFESAPDEAQDAAVARLEAAGQPLVRIGVPDLYHLGQEFFRWELATAVAGAILGINPFNQPDVEASKVATRRLTDEFEKTGALPGEEPLARGEGIRLFTDEANARALADAAGEASVEGYIRAHLERLGAGDYFALLAYLEMHPAHDAELQTMRHAVRDSRKVATTLGYGPRFLHSTGQAYKGGPNTGVFLQITCEDAEDLPVPGQRYTFGTIKAAQARGDFQVLAERRRRALRVHLGKDVPAGLALLRRLVTE